MISCRTIKLKFVNQMKIYYSTMHKTFLNPCELLCHGLHLWWIMLAPLCSPQPGEQCCMKYGFIAEYMDSWPQRIKCFLFIMMCSMQLWTQRSNSSWWHHDSQSILKLVNSYNMQWSIYVCMYFILHNTVATACQKCMCMLPVYVTSVLLKHHSV